MNLSKYKQSLKENGVTHQLVADCTGHARETVTLWLNGKYMPSRVYHHVAKELDELIKEVKFREEALIGLNRKDRMALIYKFLGLQNNFKKNERYIV